MGGGNLEDLGWNDMGFEPPKPTEAPRDEDHDAFGEDVVEHPRAHPTGPDSGSFAGPCAAGGPRGSFRRNRRRRRTRRGYRVDDCGAEATFDAEDDADFEPEPRFGRSGESGGCRRHSGAGSAPRAEAASSAGQQGQGRFTLRLDPERHLRLRLACAVDGRSAQQIVTDALDGLLESMPELDAWPRRPNARDKIT